ncbi:MAG: CDP-alcohol phosphatidyltransferase family protein, partial [Acidobacteria bacterium]|nr:CDP-alcohol phosphatidyltransferase family protein [Acidobacteriota bacterium]
MNSRILTVPNQLTFLRFVFLPFFVISIWYDHYDWALGVLIAAALSDLLDGILARRLNQKTELGAYLDPLADKLLLSSSFLLLAMKGKVVWWLTILVLARDLLILVTAAAILLVVGYRPFPPSLYGKFTTGVQIIFIFLVVASTATNYRALDILEDVFLFFVAGLTIFSGVHYSFVIA